MEGYLIGFDIGTLSSKAVLTDLQGNVVEKFQREHDIQVKYPGWQEESMEMWWEEFCQAVSCFLEKENVPAEQIRAVGVTGLIPALCAVDREGNAIRSAMLHTDVRAEHELQEIQEKLSPAVTHGHMLPKILWVKAHEPENFKKDQWSICAPWIYRIQTHRRQYHGL